MHDVTCVGMMAANIPVRPVTRAAFDVDVTLVDRMEVTPGGDAMNEAIILSRLGSRVVLCGKVGDDGFGRLLLQTARDGGVDTSAVAVDAAVSTSTCVILINEDGSRNFLSHRHANENLTLADIDFARALDARVVSIGSFLALPRLDGEPAAELLAAAKARGCITAADTKHDSYHKGYAGIRASLRHLDYLLPSYEEASYLTGEAQVPRIAEALLDAGAGTVVIKLGSRGCYARAAGVECSVPAFQAAVVDTTGAGDNFVAGFLTGVLHRWDLERCCRFANAVAAVSVTKVGSTAAVENMDQVLATMATASAAGEPAR